MGRQSKRLKKGGKPSRKLKKQVGGQAVPAVTVNEFAGSTVGFLDGPGVSAKFLSPYGGTFDSVGNMYIADNGNHVIRQINRSGAVTLYAGRAGTSGRENGSRTMNWTPQLKSMEAGIPGTFTATSSWGWAAYIGSAEAYNTVTLSFNVNKNIMNASIGITASAGGLAGHTADLNFRIYNTSTFVFNGATGVSTSIKSGGYTILPSSGLPIVNTSYTPYTTTTKFKIVYDGTKVKFYINNQLANEGDSPGPVYIFAHFVGDGQGVTNLVFSPTTLEVAPTTLATFQNPTDTAIDPAGNLYVVDNANHVIRKIDTVGAVTTFAGNGSAGFADSTTGATASFRTPYGICIDSAGTNLYVADTGNNRIRKIVINTGAVSTVAGTDTAGSNNGTGDVATFNGPRSICIDSAGILYVADYNSHIIRQITITGGTSNVTTLAGIADTAGSVDGAGTAATFNNPGGLSVDSAGNLYVSDYTNKKIRKIIIETGVVSSFTGAIVGLPTKLLIDPLRTGDMYVCDVQNSKIRKIMGGDILPVPSTLYVSTFAGGLGVGGKTAGTTNATGASAGFNKPSGGVFDSDGNMYVTDTDNHTIRKITPEGVVSLYAGIAGTAGAVNGARSTRWTPKLTSMTESTTVSSTFSSTASGTFTPTGSGWTGGYLTSTEGYNAVKLSFRVNGPVDVNIGLTTSAGGIANFASNMACLFLIRSASGGKVTTSIRDGGYTINPASSFPITDIRPGMSGQQWTSYTSSTEFTIIYDGTNIKFYINEGRWTDTGKTLNKIVNEGTSSGPLYLHVQIAGIGHTVTNLVFTPTTIATFNQPSHITIDGSGNLYVADYGNNVIRKIDTIGNVSTFAGTGARSSVDTSAGIPATFHAPTGICIDSTKKNLYVTDRGGDRIRKIIIDTRAVSTVAGNGTRGSINGAGNVASFNNPCGICIDSTGTLYVVDHESNLIRQITPEGVVSTLAGSGTSGSVDGIGTAARFNTPYGICIDSIGNLYVNEFWSNKIRKIVINTKKVTTLAGTGAGAVDGGITTASFMYPRGLLINPTGTTIFVFDSDNNKIRQISGGDIGIAPTVTAAAPAPTPGATTDYGLTGSANTINVIDPITFQKLKETTAWDTPLYSVLSVPGSRYCNITFKPGQKTTQFIIGLNDSPPSANPTDLTHSTRIDRGFHIYGNGTFHIREGGSIVTTTPITYNTGDIFGIIYDTINYTYTHNGHSIRTIHVKASPTENLPSEFYLDGSMYDPGTLIESIYFGALNGCAATS